MSVYKVEITETLQRQIEVEARSKEEAEKMIREKYRNEEIVLNDEDLKDVDIHAVGKCRCHEEER